MSHSRTGIRLAIVLSALVFGASSAPAQSAQGQFEEGMRLFRNGQHEQALQVFRSIVRMDPANVNAQQWVIYSQDALVDLMVQGGEFETFASHLLAEAGSAQREAVRDAGSASAIAARVLSGPHGERAKARFELVTKHGPFGVPPLVSALGSGSNEEQRNAATYALSRMGTEMTLPLLVASTATQPSIRSGCAIALANLNDPRAGARLADMAENDPDAVVRALAANLSPGGAPSELYFRQAMAFYVGDPMLGVTGPENYGVTWMMDGSRLTYVDVPKAIVPLEYAKHHFLRAADLGNEQGYGGAAMAYAAELANLRQLILEGDTDLQLSYNSVRAAALSLSPMALNMALHTSLARGESSTAAMLAEMLDGPAFTTPEWLEAAVDSRFPNVRHAASITMAKAGYAPASVVRALAEAANLKAMRVVHVIDSNDGRREALMNDLEAEGLLVVAAEDGASGLANLWRGYGGDLFVVSDPLPDVYARRVVSEIRSNPRYAEAPVLVVANDDTGFIEGAQNFKVVDAATVVSSLPALDAERQELMMQSQRAAQALAYVGSMSPASLEIVIAELAHASAREEDEIAVPALAALGSAGGPEAYPTLNAIVANADRTPAQRAAAADAMAALIARTGFEPGDVSALQAGYRDEDNSVREACARALGAAAAAHEAAWVGMNAEG